MGCVICKNKGFNIKIVGNYQYNICQNCGHVYQEDLKSNKFYEHLPYESQWNDYENHSRNRANYIYNFCKPHIPKNLFHADIGCGLGGPMFFMQSLFKTKNSKGFTVDKDQTKFSPSLDIKYLDFLKVKNDKKFDFITLVHVLEHFPDPIKALQKIKQDLNLKGYLYIEVPSFEWVELHLKEKFCPVHISYFSKKQLINLFRILGFTIIKQKESKYWGNLKFLLKNELDIPKENAYIKLIRSKMIKIILFPVFRLIRKIKVIKPND